MAPSLWPLMFLQEVPKALEKLAPFGDGIGLCHLCLVIQEGNPISFPFVTRNRKCPSKPSVDKSRWVGARLERDLWGAFVNPPRTQVLAESAFGKFTHPKVHPLR